MTGLGFGGQVCWLLGAGTLGVVDDIDCADPGPERSVRFSEGLLVEEAEPGPEEAFVLTLGGGRVGLA